MYNTTDEIITVGDIEEVARIGEVVVVDDSIPIYDALIDCMLFAYPNFSLYW